MKITDLWKRSDKPTLSFEVFPARTEKAAANLEPVLDQLVGLGPDFMSVTFGAGGSTRGGSYQLIKRLIEEKKVPVIAYFACYGLAPGAIDAVLESYQALGVLNVLAVRGDKPHDEAFVPDPQSLPYASDLLGYIRPRYPFCLGAAGYPEGHIAAESLESDLRFLKLKVEQGAEFIITNYCYDNRYFFDFVDRCLAVGIKVPILPGVMPIYSVKMMHTLASICGATITESVEQGLRRLPEDDQQALLDFGIEYATEQCAGLLRAGVPGIHIYSMDRSSSALGIVPRLRAQGLL